MPRAMSFMLTQQQVLDGTKTQTRRLGWTDAREGDVLNAVRKAMGLKRGEHQQSLGLIRITRVRRERLNTISAADVRREGFPEMTPAAFIELFCKANKCPPTAIVTVIDFERQRD